MKTFGILFLLVLVTACGEQSDLPEGETFDVPVVEDNLDLPTRAKRHVEAALSIPSTENYDLQIFEKNCDEDEFMDAVILVNRKERAYQEAEQKPNTAQRAHSGFLGMYNYVFYFDGDTKKITRPIPFGSSAIYPLTIRFEHVYSQNYFDFIIEHRINDGGFSSYFSVKQHTPFMIFQWKAFDGLRTENPIGNYFAYGEGKISEAKDILIFEGKFKEKPKMEELGIGEKVEKTDKLLYRFFYNPTSGKYATNDRIKE